jgi:hypothetical protein
MEHTNEKTSISDQLKQQYSLSHQGKGGKIPRPANRRRRRLSCYFQPEHTSTEAQRGRERHGDEEIQDKRRFIWREGVKRWGCRRAEGQAARENN